LTFPEHACAIASSLGINRIIIHTYSSILSAYGIAVAEVESEAAEPCSLTFSMDVLPQIRDRIEALKSKVKQDLVSQDIKEASITYTALLSLHYQGTETILPIITPNDEDYGKAFAKMHLREFGFNLAKKVLVSEIKVRATGSAAQDSRASEEINFEELNLLKEESHEVSPSAAQPVYLDEGWQEVPIYKVEEIPHGAKISVGRHFDSLQFTLIVLIN
jgi:5-oxoprolinase (ATP-hydrolysing)